MSDSLIPYVGVEEITANKILVVKSFVAEFIGTLFLVLVGCGSCYNANGDFVRIGLAFGITVATMAQSIGHISGCHINPAITCGLFAGSKIGLIKAIIYLMAQVLGGIVGAFFLKVMTPGGALGVTSLGGGIDQGQAVGIEFFITFVLVLVVFAAAADAGNSPNVKGSAPLAIGLSITTCHLFAIPLTGSSMNPARSLGPAVAWGMFEDQWVYWVGPILGGVCAGIVYQLLFRAEPYAPVAIEENDKDQA